MFEIGSSLREARVRRKLELSQVEADTRIRAKYLMALESNRFEALPAPAYAKGFLRTYADYLGLDAQRFVDEYSTRFAPDEVHEGYHSGGARRQGGEPDGRALIDVGCRPCPIGERLECA